MNKLKNFDFKNFDFSQFSSVIKDKLDNKLNNLMEKDNITQKLNKYEDAKETFEKISSK